VCDPLSITTDNKGNVFEAGLFQGSVKFGNDTITTTGSNTEAFIVKYDSNGNVLWAKSANAANLRCVSSSFSVATDNKGNSYITGNFIDSINFGAFKIVTKGGDAFLVKYAPNGNVLWARSSKEISGGVGIEAFSVATDKSCNIYISGRFSDTISFGSQTTISKVYDVFLVKFDSNGNTLWLKSGLTSNSLSSSYTYEVATDNNNNVYLTGSMLDTVSFGTYRLTTYSPQGSIFLVKYDSNGNVKWAKNSLGIHSFIPFLNYSYSVVTDKSGCIYITGQFGDSITFGSYELNTHSPIDIFFVKYDTSGNIIWAQNGKSLFDGVGYSLSVDKWDHIYLAGSFNDSIAFGSVKLISSSYLPSCIFVFDTSGKALCGASIDNNNDDANAIAANPFGHNVYFGGDVESGQCVFGNDTLNGGTNEYSFLAKWQPCNNTITSVNSVTEKNSIAIFPNPNNGVFTIQSSVAGGPLSVEVYNVLGKKVLTEALLSPQGNNVINLSDDPSGIYLYRVLNEDGGLLGSGKVIIDK